MADFVSNFWHWFILILSLISILALLPLTILNRGKPQKGRPKTVGHVWDKDLKEYNNPLPRWWINMFYITIAFGLVYLLLYPGLGKFQGLLGWSQLQQYSDEIQAANAAYGPIFKKYAARDIKGLAKDSEAIKTGERLFANYCSVCHGSDARGAIGFPNLRDNNWSWGGEPEQIKASIMNGRSGVMPGWKAALGGDAGVNNVTEYVLSLSGRQHDAAAASVGQKKFKQLCIACHGADARGNQKLGAPNLTDRIWLYGGSRKSVRASIANGRQGRMPPNKDFLGEDKVHLLSAYVYGLSQEYERE